jgi:hypothetical protein
MVSAEDRYIYELLDAAIIPISEEDLPVHTIEQVARTMLNGAVSAPHYNERILETLGDLRTVTFTKPEELEPLSERMDQLQLAIQEKLEALLDSSSHEEIETMLNDLDYAKMFYSKKVYDLCCKIRFLHDTGCQLLHWI